MVVQMKLFIIVVDDKNFKWENPKQKININKVYSLAIQSFLETMTS